MRCTHTIKKKLKLGFKLIIMLWLNFDTHALTYPPSAQLKEYVDIVRVLEKPVKANNMLVGQSSVDSYLLGHLYAYSER